MRQYRTARRALDIGQARARQRQRPIHALRKSDLLRGNFHAMSRSLSPTRAPGTGGCPARHGTLPTVGGSEEHTSELQSLMRISYAVFCLKKKKTRKTTKKITIEHI